MVLHYFGEVVDEATCQNLGGTLCDNCQKREVEAPLSAEGDFKIIADSISDLPNHGITKVKTMHSSLRRDLM